MCQLLPLTHSQASQDLARMDRQTNRHGNRKVTIGPAGGAVHTWLVTIYFADRACAVLPAGPLSTFCVCCTLIHLLCMHRYIIAMKKFFAGVHQASSWLAVRSSLGINSQSCLTPQLMT